MSGRVPLRIAIEWVLFHTGCQDFADCIRNTVKPGRSREMHVECINAFHDWQEYMEPLNVSLSGLAIVDHDQDVNFSFRFVTRADLSKYHGFNKWMEMDEGEKDIPTSWCALRFALRCYVVKVTVKNKTNCYQHQN